MALFRDPQLQVHFVVLDALGICLADEDTAHPVGATKQSDQYPFQ